MKNLPVYPYSHEKCLWCGRWFYPVTSRQIFCNNPKEQAYNHPDGRKFFILVHPCLHHYWARVKEVQEYGKQYREDHKLHHYWRTVKEVWEYKKQYDENHREEKAAYDKQYREDQKEEIAVYNALRYLKKKKKLKKEGA